MDLLMNNYEWIFSGIGVVILGGLFTFFLKRNQQEKFAPSGNSQQNSNTITINNNLGSQDKEKIAGSTQGVEKNSCNILFIDDQHTDFKMVSILKKAGWNNQKQLKI